MRSPGRPAERHDHERRPRTRGERGRGAVGERARAEEVDDNAVIGLLGHLIDEHGHRAPAAKGLARRDERTLRTRELHTVALASPSHEPVEPAHRDGLHDDEQVEGPRHGARGELPISRVGRRQDGASSVGERVLEESLRPGVERADLLELAGLSSRKPEELHHARTERAVHPERRAPGLGAPRSCERRLDVTAAHAEDRPEEPGEGDAEGAEPAEGEARDDRGEGAEGKIDHERRRRATTRSQPVAQAYPAYPRAPRRRGRRARARRSRA